MRQRLLWLLLLGVAVAILVLIARHGAGTVGPLTTDEFGSLAYKARLWPFGYVACAIAAWAGGLFVRAEENVIC